MPWYAKLEKLLVLHDYHAERIFNMDASGYDMGTTVSKRVMSVKVFEGEKQSNAGNIQLVTHGRQEWVTTLECIWADGGLLLW